MAIIKKHNEELITVFEKDISILSEKIFKNIGCSNEEAVLVSKRLIKANLRGHDSHGILRILKYVKWIKEGILFPNRNITIEDENQAFAIINGNYGFGQIIGDQACDLGIKKSKNMGISVIALKNSGHLGCISDYAEKAALEGIASIHMVNVKGSLLVAPFGGTDRRTSTGPFCSGVPNENGHPIILDFTTASIAEGKVNVAMKKGERLPNASLISKNGEFTTDPRMLYGDTADSAAPDARKGDASILAFGQHKGSGLNIFMEIFGGILTGSGCAGIDGDLKRNISNGMLSIYLNIENFDNNGFFHVELKSFIDFLKSSKPSDDGVEILYPGEKEIQIYEKRSKYGFKVPKKTYDDLVNLTKQWLCRINDVLKSIGIEQ